MPPKAVLFDLDDTLFDHRATSRAALSALREEVPALQALAFDDLERRHVAVLEELHHSGVMQGVMSVDEAREERFSRLLEAAGTPASPEAAAAAAARYRDLYGAARREVPGARALVEALARRVRLAVVSNNILAEQEAKLNEFGMRPFVDALVVSAEVGVSKPDPAIFQIALARLGLPPGEAVMVGDSWPIDIVGATRAGLRAVWLNRTGEPCPDALLAAEIRSLEPTTAVSRVVLGTREPENLRT